MKYLSSSNFDERFLEEIKTDFSSLNEYQSWDYDAIFRLSFNKAQLRKLDFNPKWVIPWGFDIIGRINSQSPGPRKIFEQVISKADEFDRFGITSVEMSFARKDQVATVSPPSVGLSRSLNRSEIRVTLFRDGEEIPEIAREAQEIMEASRLVIPGTGRISSLQVSYHLPALTMEAVELQFLLADRLGSGTTFNHCWDIGISRSDVEMAKLHGFELFNLIADSDLNADEYQIEFALEFTDLRGVNVVRQLSEGEQGYEMPLGTFQFRDEEALVGIHVNANGYRMALHLEEAPSEEEWSHLESVLGCQFDRNPVIGSEEEDDQ